MGRHDPLGALLLALALASLTAGLSLGNEVGWRSSTPLLLGVTGLAGAVALLVHESRHPHPIIDLALFQNRLFACASLSQVLSFVAMFAVSFLLPFYFEQLRGFDTATTGLMLTPLPLTLAVIGPLSGSLADRIGTRWLATAGMAFAVLGLLLLAQIDAASSKPDIIWRLTVAGLGQGLFQSPNNSALLGAAPRHRQGVASGLLATGRIVGQSLSVAIAGALFTSLGGAAAGRALASAHGPAVAALRSTFLTSFHTALYVCAAVAAIGVLTSMVRGSERA